MAASVTHKPKAGALLTGTEYEAADSHTVSITAADVGAEDAGAVATHAAAGDPHTGYLKESDFAGVDALVGTATGLLSGEIVVGTAPGGELGGTWASPTVDATHSGSAHVALGTSPSTQAFGDAAAGGAATDAAKTDHKHAFPALGTTPSTQAFGDAAAGGAATTPSKNDHKHAMPADPVTAHAAAADPHTGYVLESLLDAKGDIIAASADNTPAKVTVGADDTILMADSAQTAGVKWVASASPSTQAFADAATTGTADTFTRGDHKHAMPTLGYGLSGNSAPALALTTASAFVTATTSVSAATYADITGASVTLAAGTWLLGCNIIGSSVNAHAIMHGAITDNANAIIIEGSQAIPASGSASVASDGCIHLVWVVTPGSSTTYKLRAARGLTTLTGTWTVMDGTGTNTTNNLTDNSDKGSGIFAVRIA